MHEGVEKEAEMFFVTAETWLLNTAPSLDISIHPHPYEYFIHFLHILPTNPLTSYTLDL